MIGWSAERYGRRGSALFVSVFVVLGLFALSAGFLRLTSSVGREVSAQVEDQRALMLAEAGVRESVEAILAGSSGNVGTMDTPAYLGGGVFWVEATQIDVATYQVVSTALAGSGRAALDVVVGVLNEDDPLFWATLNSDETLTINSDVMIDSFDSSVGSYDSQAVNETNGIVHANVEGHVASNMDVILNANAHVFGDAVPGVGHSVQFNQGSYVHGSTAPAPEPFTFPPIKVPPIPQSEPFGVPEGGSEVLPPGEHGFTDLAILKDGTLTVQGPATIVVDTFLGDKDANLLVDASGGPVTFHVKETYTHQNGFEASPVADSPMAIAFMIGGEQDIVFPSKTMVRGAYYAPNAGIHFTSANEAWGSFAAKRVEMSNGMKFHYDEDLANHWGGDGDPLGPPYDVFAWLHTEVAPASLRADRRDATAVLGVDAGSLPSPSEAWLP